MEQYDKYIVTFSGGKDSLACLLYLLSISIPPDKIEIWHHDVDGKGDTFMDWECTPAYCRAVAAHFNIPIYFSWKEGGFEQEMLRDGDPTASNHFEVPFEEYAGSPVDASWDTDIDRFVLKSGGRGNPGTRMKFPQVSGDLSVRWCSAYLKIDPCAVSIRNQRRFNDIRTVVISGERGEESAQRAKYADLELDRSDNRGGRKVDRYVDRWRPIKNWTERQVWEIIERYHIRVHPCYYLGFGRCSCRNCIFANANQMASAYKINPIPVERMIAYEEQFGVTIKRKVSLRELIAAGTPYDMDPEIMAVAISHDYNLSVIISPWFLPSGAYGDGCGPT